MNQRSNCQHTLDHRESKRVPEKHLLLLYWLEQSLWLCGSQQTVENTSRDENTRPPNCLLRNLYTGQEAIVTTRHGTIDWSKLRKEYVKAAYCHPAYLTYMQSTSHEMPGWMNHKLESRLPGEIINNLRYADDTTLTAESKEPLDEGERGEWKS